jgi:FkbM family methyltransferase
MAREDYSALDSTHHWPIQTGISPEFVPSLVAALLRSWVSTRPREGWGPYYEALLLSPMLSLLKRRLVLPNELLAHDVTLRFDDACWLLNRTTLFAYYLLPFEPVTRRFLLSLRGNVCIDGGANVGQYTVPLSKRFKQVVAVEPNPVAAAILRKNLLLNQVTNVKVVEKAITVSGGKTRLYKGDFLSTWSTVRTSPEFTLVDSITLSDLIGEYPEVDLIKLDVEGIEHELLYSARMALPKVHRIVVETVHRETLRTLWDAGYEVSVLGGLLHRWENVEASRPPSSRSENDS